MCNTRPPGLVASPRSRALLVNAAVLTVATILLAATPATVSFPIAVAEAVVLAAGLALAVALNLVLLRETHGAARGHVPATAVSDAPPRAEHVIHASPSRLFVCWSAPPRLSDDEAAAWASTELAHAIRAARVDAARLTRLRSAGPAHVTPCDWLLEVGGVSGQRARACLEVPAWADWLDDLQLLGLSPAAMVADHSRLVTAREE